MAAADVAAEPGTARRYWLLATVALTGLPLLVGLALWPVSTDGTLPGLAWLLFVGSSVHVGATGWFYSVAEVRAHLVANPARYLWVPLVLVVILAGAAATLSTRGLGWLLLGFFGWQFFHFQKQNLGLAALAARGYGASGLTATERRALVAAGLGGTAALVGHPALLQVAGVTAHGWLFTAGAVVFVAGVLSGAACLSRRAAADRPGAFVTVYLLSSLFFLPVFCFASPYPAVAGLTIAHGLQYLLLMGLLAARPVKTRPASVGLLMLLNIAIVTGLLLNWSSHLHGGNLAARLVFGCYLGLSCAHFVVDAGLWRLRDDFPRRFLTARLPFLLGR